MGDSCSPGCRWWYLLWRLCVMSFFLLDVVDEIWDVIESVSEGFLAYSFMLNSVDHEIVNAYKYENMKKVSFFQVRMSLEC